MPNFDSFSSKEKDMHICGRLSMSVLFTFFFFFHFGALPYPRRPLCIASVSPSSPTLVRRKIQWLGDIKNKRRNKQNDWPPLFINACFAPILAKKSAQTQNSHYTVYKLHPRGSVGKESTCSAGVKREWGFDLWVGRIPWRRKWQPTPGFLPGECHGQRSLEGYSPQGHRELDTSEWLAVSHFQTQLTFLLCSGSTAQAEHPHIQED